MSSQPEGPVDASSTRSAADARPVGATGSAGLVLAAGRSTRMGAPKPLLDAGDGRTFLEATVAALREAGCSPVLAVTSGDDVAAEARRGAAVPIDGRPDGEQVDSLRAGLNALEWTLERVVLLPVDHPLVRPETVRALLDEAGRRSHAIVRPVHAGVPGHPTIFPRGTWPALRDPDLPRGARSVVEAPDTELIELTVEDPGVTADIDTPDAYRRHIGGAPARADRG